LHTGLGLLLITKKGMITDNTQNHRDGIIALLKAERLPTQDLPDILENFIVALQDEDVIGVAGLEIYGDYGLFRSLAVHKQFRNKGIAQNLMQQIEVLANKQQLHELYLLTETAPDYFERNGYQKISRDEVPVIVQQSAEFSEVCPQSAIVMKKSINHL